MNITTVNTTISTNAIDPDIIKYGSVEDIVYATGQFHTESITKAREQADLFVDVNTTNLIASTADEVQAIRTPEEALQYISKAQSIVKDKLGLLDTKRKNLLSITQKKEEVVETHIIEDERVAKLEKEKKELEAKLNDQYTDAVAKEAVLKNELERAEKVIKKLETGEDKVKALKEAERLRQKLNEVEGEAKAIPALKEQLNQSRDAIENAKAYANGLKMQIARAADEVKAEKARVEKLKGEALLTAEEVETAKAIARQAAFDKMKESYSLKEYALDNGFTEEEFNEAQITIDAKEYDTQTAEEIANIIITTESCENAINKISGVIGVAIRRAKHAELKSRYATMKYNYIDTMKALIAERV